MKILHNQTLRISGKDYKRHVALSRFMSTEDYHIKKGYVISNNREVETSGAIAYIPVYYTIFLEGGSYSKEPILI